jgi:hypothetical protein
VTITLQNTLTITGGQSSDSGTSQFNWAGGSLIPAASGNNLVLNDINPDAGGDHNASYWSGGTFGDDIHQMTLVLLGASQLNVGTVTMNGAIQVGESSGPTTANLLTLGDGATLTLGTASTVSHTITVNGYGDTPSE